MNTIGCTATLAEQFYINPSAPPERDVLDALRELEAWKDAAWSGDKAVESPEELEARIATLEAIEEKPKDYDDLKSFFDDCVESLNAHWPAAEPYDQNLRQVIMNAITRGDVEETEEV